MPGIEDLPVPTEADISGLPVPPKEDEGGPRPFFAPGQTVGKTAKAVGSALAGALLEAPAAMATGAVTSALGGIGGGLRTLGGLAMGESMEQAGGAGADVVRGVQRLTYPPQTQMGQYATRMMGAPFAAASEGLGKLASAAGAGPGMQTVAETAPEAAGALLGARGTMRAGRAPVQRAPLTQGQAAMQEAQQAGFKSLPSEAQPGITRSTMEAASYRPQLIKDLVRENETNATNLVKRDLGLAPTDYLDAPTLGRLRTAAGSVYDRVRNLPFRIDIARTDPNFRTAVMDLDSQFRSMKNVLPELYNQPGLERLRAGLSRLTDISPAEIVDITKNLWDISSNTFKNPSASDQALTSARAMREGANLLEGLLQTELQARGSPLYNDFTAARQQIAKIYDAEAMSDLVKGVVNPQVARRMLEKDVPLTGGMLSTARAAAAMPSVVRSSEGMGIRAEGGTRVLTSAPARAVVKSEAYQRGLTPQGRKLPRPLPMADAALAGAAGQPERTPFKMSEEEAQ